MQDTPIRFFNRTICRHQHARFQPPMLIANYVENIFIRANENSLDSVTTVNNIIYPIKRSLFSRMNSIEHYSFLILVFMPCCYGNFYSLSNRMIKISNRKVKTTILTMIQKILCLCESVTH